MSTPQAEAMREVVTRVAAQLTAAGFRERRYSFNRSLAPGLVHVITYRLGPADPPGVQEVPGVHMNLKGLAAVQLGVFIAESWQLQHHHRTESHLDDTSATRAQPAPSAAPSPFL